MPGKFIHDISATTLQVIINQFFGFAIFYILSVSFSKNIFGEINWTLAILLTAFSILSLGIDQIIIKKIAAGEDSKIMLSVYFTHVLLCGFLFYLFLLISTFLFPQIFLKHYLLLFFGIGKLMIFFASPFKQMANGLEKYKSLFYMSVCSNIIRGIALILLSFFSVLNVTSLIIVFIAGDVAELLVSFFITDKVLKVSLTRNWNKKKYFSLIKESLPQAGVVIFTSAIARFDWIFLGILATDVVLADYSFAFRVFEVSTLPLLIIAPVLIPRFTKLFQAKNAYSKATFNNFFVLLKFEIIIASLVALLVNILWVPVIDFVTHGKYGLVNRTTIFILSLSMPFIYANNFLWSINFAQSHLKMIFNIFFITFLINTTGDIILIPVYGGEGAAVAYFLAILVQFILFSLKTVGPEIRKNQFVFLTPLAAIAGAALPSFLFGPGWINLVISFLCFFLLVIFMKLHSKKNAPLLKRMLAI
jgi:O-antigen/teichoic acid export membrane protein